MNYKKELSRVDERNAVEIYGAYKFVKLLSTAWEDWEAFELGLIDSKGDKIRKAKTQEEKKAFGLFEIVVRNIKQLIERLPFGKTRIASYATALFLMREQFAGIECFTAELCEQLGNQDDSSLIVESSGRFTFHKELYTDIVETSGIVTLDNTKTIVVGNMTFYVGEDIVTRERIIIPANMLETI